MEACSHKYQAVPFQVVPIIDRPGAGSKQDLFEPTLFLDEMEVIPVQKVRLKMSTQTHRRSTRHQHRRYSWPPSLQLIDISTIRVPLPDIDDDPFAHFVSLAEDDFEPALDSVAIRAGIVATHHSPSKNDEKAYKFRTSIARKWSRFISRYYAKLPHSNSETKDKKTYVGKGKAKKMSSSTQTSSSSRKPSSSVSTTEASSSTKTNSTSQTESSEPAYDNTQATPAETENQRQYQRPSVARQCHSFSEYSNRLPTILEMENEDIQK